MHEQGPVVLPNSEDALQDIREADEVRTIEMFRIPVRLITRYAFTVALVLPPAGYNDRFPVKATTLNELGYKYENGIGVLQDRGAAEKWYRLAAAQGYAAAQYNLGQMYDNYGDCADDEYCYPDEAEKWYLKAADQGYASAQYRLGQMYQGGSGVSQHGSGSGDVVSQSRRSGKYRRTEQTCVDVIRRWPRRAPGLRGGGEVVSQGR